MRLAESLAIPESELKVERERATDGGQADKVPVQDFFPIRQQGRLHEFLEKLEKTLFERPTSVS